MPSHWHDYTPQHQHLSQKHGKAYQIQRLGNRGWVNVGAQNNNSPSGYGSPWHHQEGHGKLLQQNPWQHQHTWTPENNSPFYSPPSQAGPLHQVETLFAIQSLWFGLGCWERKSIAITVVYLTYQATIGLETYLRNTDDALLQLVLQHETKKNLTPPKKKQRNSEENLRYKPR